MKHKASSSFLHTSHLSQNGTRCWPSCHLLHLTFAIICIILAAFINSTQATRSAAGEYMDDYFNSGEEGESYGMDSLGEFKLPIRQINYISPSELVPKSQFRHEEPLSFSAKGMDHLYLLNNFLMNLLQQSGLPNSILTDQLFTDPVSVAVQNRSRLLSHFWGMILAATIGVCLVVIIPMLGFLFCCCWCDEESSSSRRTRAKSTRESRSVYSSSSHPKHLIKARTRSRKRYRVEKGCDSCCRSFFSVIHFLLLLLITFFVICAFVTNEYIKDGLHKLPKTLNQSLDDFSIYLNNTQHEVNTLLLTNYGQLEAEISNSLDQSGVIVKNRLAQVSQADALDNLTEIVTKLDIIHNGLKSLAHETTEIRNSIHLLSTGLHRARKDLEKVFAECKDECSSLRGEFRSRMEKFRTTSKFDHLPDMNQLMNNITSLLRADIVNIVKRGKYEFDGISIQIQKAVNGSIPRIKQQIHEIGQILAQHAIEFNKSLQLPNRNIEEGKDKVGVGEKYIEAYEMYRWYACLAGSGVIGLILACYTLGFLNGVCGTQPSVIDYRNRGKKPPSTWLLKFGIFIFFVFFSVLLLATIGLFAIGGVFDRVGCYYLEHPSDNSTVHLVSIVQDKLNLAFPFHVKPNVADVLSRCHQNRSLYNSIQLYKYNVRIPLSNGKFFEGNISSFLQVKGKEKIREHLNALLESVNVTPGPIEILPPQASQLLEKLKETSFGNFTFYSELHNQPATPLNIPALCSQLNEAADLVPNTKIELKTNLRNIALILESYNTKVIPKILHSMNKLKEIAAKIEMEAQYGNKGLKEALTDFIEKAQNAQRFIQDKGKSEIRRVAAGFINDIYALIDQYAVHVVKEVETNVGKCEPVSRAVNASVLAMCKETVLPFNGYWLSMASALVLCIPTTLSAYVLSSLYSKLRPNPVRRQSTGSDLALDTIDEDDVPLSHVTNKHESTSHSYALETRRAGPSGHYPGHSSHSASASAPIVGTDDHWSPGPPLYTRPPPYNFN